MFLDFHPVSSTKNFRPTNESANDLDTFLPSTMWDGMGMVFGVITRVLSTAMLWCLLSLPPLPLLQAYNDSVRDQD